MSEEIEKLVSKLKEKYPKAKMFLDDVVFYANWIEDRAEWCEYNRLLDSFGKFRTSMSSAFKVGDMHAEDIVDLLEIEDKFRTGIEKTLKERCGCK